VRNIFSKLIAAPFLGVVDDVKRHLRAQEIRADELRREEKANADVFQLGREAADKMIEAADSFIDLKARPMAEGLWRSFIQRLAAIEADNELVKLDSNGKFDLSDVARVEAEDFISAMNEFHARSCEEAAKQLSGWIELGRSSGHEDVLVTYVGDKIDQLDREFRDRCRDQVTYRMNAYQPPQSG